MRKFGNTLGELPCYYVDYAGKDTVCLNCGQPVEEDKMIFTARMTKRVVGCENCIPIKDVAEDEEGGQE